MANFACIGFCFLLAPFASADTMTTLLLTAAHSTVRAALRSPHGTAAQTLYALDKNQDGHVDRKEVAAFARSEGLDATSALGDFSGIDTNGDGVLDPPELLQVIGGSGGAPATNATGTNMVQQAVTAPPKAQVPATPATKELASVQTVKVPGHIVTGRAAEKPAATKVGKKEAHISIQEAHPAKVAAKQEVRAPPVVEAVKPAPVERMVKHFAQVLRTADVVPLRTADVAPVRAPDVVAKRTAPKRTDTVKLPKSAKPAAKVNFHAEVTDEGVVEDTRATVQSAAKEVAEQLSLAESAQAKARILDRKAAEERANATVLAKLTTQEALNAGAAAAHSKANELLAKIAKLEDQAERAQVRSAALHSKAKLETEEASELMAVADRALNHRPSHSA